MQTSRNVFLWQSRTWLRKILEAYYTVLIEIFWGKARILEVYLNVIEWGDGIFGSSQAAQIYFSQPTKVLTIKNSVWLASILPNPRVWSKKSSSRNLIKANMRLLKGMKFVKVPSSIFKETSN